jgi:hypothetical protein
VKTRYPPKFVPRCRECGELLYDANRNARLCHDCEWKLRFAAAKKKR